MNLNEAKEFAWWLWRKIIGFIIILIIILALINFSPIGRDDTDPGEWGERSEVALRIDSLTGCQYLETNGGGITPRLNRQGGHVGCK